MAASAAYSRRSFPGGAISTTVPTGMGSSDTTYTLALATGWTVTNNWFTVVDRGLSTEEKIENSGIASLVVSVANRGADGTSAVAHSANCTVQACHVARDDDEANQVVAAVLGQSGAAKGDILAMLSAAGPNTLTRIPIGSGTQVLGVSAGLPAYFSPSNTTVLGWQGDTGWVTLASASAGYTNSWGSNTGPAGAASIRKIGNEIQLAGVVTGGASGTAVCTLSAAYRPTYTVQEVTFMTDAGTTICHWSVTSAGVLTVSFATGVSPTLNGLFWTSD